MEHDELLRKLREGKSARIQLTRVIIKGFQQFQDLDLDLCYPSEHPKAGQPLEKVCLIGPNGTGKTTLLRILSRYLSTGMLGQPYHMKRLAIKLDVDGVALHIVTETALKARAYFFEPFESTDYAQRFLFSDLTEADAHLEELISLWVSAINDSGGPQEKSTVRSDIIRVSGEASRLIVNIPAEVEKDEILGVSNVPQSSVDKALRLMNSFSSVHQVSPSTVNQFWTTLIYHIKKRDSDFHDFQRREENLDRTVRQVTEEFEQSNPHILEELSSIWNRILKPAALKFDVENASNPVQLKDNLNAYIVSERFSQRVPYNALSSGIRNFIFRIGHLYSLYFNRDISTGFLFLDEPEKSLFPDFLYDIVDEYCKITRNTQVFMATHSPIVAAQFLPSERVLLDFEEDGAVTARRGVAPVGDDPNDLLIQDFEVRSLLGKEGQEKWDRFVEIKMRLSRPGMTEQEKLDLAKEYMAIGNEYGFSDKAKKS